MSSKKTKKSELSGKKPSDVEKTQIIHGRIKAFYGLSGGELGERLAGISKEAIYKREKNGKYSPDEIIRAFPDINQDWIFSESINDLKKLPVRRLSDPKVANADSVDLSANGLSDQNKKELLEQIESIVKILKGTI
jgi:predicted oxidoreductase